VKQLELANNHDLNAFEMRIFQIQNENNSITCCIIYHPPAGASQLSLFFSNFTKLCQDRLRYKRILIIGDFNLPQNQFNEDSI
jgi:hypothetical protein